MAISGGQPFAVAMYHTCAISTEKKGAVKCVGFNGQGEIGNGTTIDATTAAVQVVGFDSDVTAISGIGLSTCAIKAGALYCWGFNDYGQLGDGTKTSYAAPYKVFDSDVTQVAAGRWHTCAIKAGALYCWGYNFYGQLGNGNQELKATPQLVTDMETGITAVAVGSDHTCAIKAGALYCWGYNNYGQLGNGQATGSLVPIQVTGMNDGVTAVVTTHDVNNYAYDTTCAIHAGAMKCWGANHYGNLGIGTVVSPYFSQTPQIVPELPNVTRISGGGNHICAVSNGALFCWGYNVNGQLGSGNLVQKNSPNQVDGMDKDVTEVVAGRYGTCAVQAGKYYCWGYNNYGQLNKGDNITRTGATEVSY
jgi:alpha-tubulin suppressor-like RCC1 family protein